MLGVHGAGRYQEQNRKDFHMFRTVRLFSVIGHKMRAFLLNRGGALNDAPSFNPPVLLAELLAFWILKNLKE
jgi:hypothetical protein